MWNYDIKAVYMVAFTNFVQTGYAGQMRIDVIKQMNKAVDFLVITERSDTRPPISLLIFVSF